MIFLTPSSAFHRARPGLPGPVHTGTAVDQRDGDAGVFRINGVQDAVAATPGRVEAGRSRSKALPTR